jgi:hypothetical protein
MAPPSDDKRPEYVPATDHGPHCRCLSETCTGGFPRLAVAPEWQAAYDRKVLPTGGPAMFHWTFSDPDRMMQEVRDLNIGGH